MPQDSSEPPSAAELSPSGSSASSAAAAPGATGAPTTFLSFFFSFFFWFFVSAAPAAAAAIRCPSGLAGAPVQATRTSHSRIPSRLPLLPSLASGSRKAVPASSCACNT